jgi:CRISPR-associated protein Cas1
MKIAIIDKKDVAIKLENSAIKIEGQTIPFKLMDTLILNHKATLTTADILKLTKNNISIILLAYNNEHTSIISSGNTQAGELKLAQYNSLQHKIKFAQYFIEQKLIRHKEQLKLHGIHISIEKELETLYKAQTIEEIMGIEGAFARAYFKELFSLFPKSLHKNRRSKNPPQDPVNAVLSYWYTLYYNIISVKLLSYGFEPSLGYLHTPFRTHNALASDMMELFRSYINEAVVSLFKHNALKVDDFYKKRGVYLKYEGRTKIHKEFLALQSLLKPKLDETIATVKKMIHEKV